MAAQKTEPASCKNCKHTISEKCELSSKPDERGLCDRYEMGDELKKKVVRLLVADVMEQIKSSGASKKK
ncbi:MAG: hypothetical protein PHH26_03395 [Candidatus Thermoplasmatota archaeon]|nr:hypothetical protein [Candidatus Thermoplasmatota archaeon]